jgi:hypothetical protein
MGEWVTEWVSEWVGDYGWVGEWVTEGEWVTMGEWVTPSMSNKTTGCTHDDCRRRRQCYPALQCGALLWCAVGPSSSPAA